MLDRKAQGPTYKRTEAGGLAMTLRWHGAIYLDRRETEALAASLLRSHPELFPPLACDQAAAAMARSARDSGQETD